MYLWRVSSKMYQMLSYRSSICQNKFFLQKIVKMFGRIKRNAYLCIDKTSKRYESCRRRAAIFVSTH